MPPVAEWRRVRGERRPLPRSVFFRSSTVVSCCRLRGTRNAAVLRFVRTREGPFADGGRMRVARAWVAECRRARTTPPVGSRREPSVSTISE
ncbi:hypothetical protein C7S16_6131 [Burkholderia thailandensis]|uniref:Uncharacterized protein n=1 Tax=Burkholderia thailandensis TaxID=57975 RepID=A0AAW9CZC0_BURTH|nr:hypothetical protein [Burkholderia thailandensis]MDW9253046.1 hypothetical protein [Burkholderia thailandensis]